MKKINLVFGILIALIFLSCSSDDDSQDSVVNEPITGIWKYTRAIDFFNNTKYEFLANECSSQGRQVFKSNGNYSFTTYHQSQSDCIKGYYSTSGSWTKINDKYQINYEYECIGNDCDDETPPNIILVDENTLRIQYNGETVNGKLTEYYFREYIKE